jgi:predicted thioesterase
MRRKLRVVLHADGQRIKGTTADLSTGGMLVTCAHLLIPGTKLRGELALTEEQVLPFEAQVRWSRNSTRWLAAEIQHSMGLEFLRPPGPEYLAFLETTPQATLSVASVRAQTKLPPNRGAVKARQETKEPPPAPPLPRRSVVGPPPLARTALASSATPAPIGASAPPPTPVLSPSPPPLPEKTEETDVREVVASVPEENPFGELSAGLSGTAHGSAAHKKEKGSSPLAPSTAAGLIERAAVRAVSARLPEGFKTVGLAIDIELRKPPLVVLGTVLEARATLLRLQPDRTLVFSCEVRQNDQLIASGQHRRLIIEIADPN